MDIHIVFVAVGLFALTFMSPGPNLLIIVQTSLTRGRTAGVVTGLGVATGDAIYAGLGLFGFATLISSGGLLFSAVKVAGGAYLVWYGLRALLGKRGTRPAADELATVDKNAAAVHSYAGLFGRGLLTDLANPQTVLFFVSIFSVTLKADTGWWLRLATWTGIVLTSIVWRVVVSCTFSRPAMRRAYLRVGHVLERIVGAALAGFGARLLHQGLHRH